jgi:hypothetical protein
MNNRWSYNLGSLGICRRSAAHCSAGSSTADRASPLWRHVMHAPCVSPQSTSGKRWRPIHRAKRFRIRPGNVARLSTAHAASPTRWLELGYPARERHEVPAQETEIAARGCDGVDRLEDGGARYRATRWAGTVMPALGGARSPAGAVAHIMSGLPQQSESASLARSLVGWPGLRNRRGVGQELVL